MTYVDDCPIVFHIQDTIASLIELLNNGPENCVFTDEGDISNDLGVNIMKNSYGTFELLQSHLEGEIINHVGLSVSASLNFI